MTQATSWIEIDRQRLRANVGAFRDLMDPECALMVVVKANAYGHGLSEVAPLVAEEANWLGVNSLDEALALHRLGIGKPIAIFGYTPESRAGEVVGHGFHQVVFRIDSAESLSEAGREANRTALAHIKIETGTHRLGVPVSELEAFSGEMDKLSGLRVEGMYTHFANIEDTLNPSFAELQLRRFREALEITERAGIEPRLIHAAATAGALLYPETHFSMVRVGIGAYGVWPSRETRLAFRERGKQISLQPVLTWKTRIAQIKDVAAGDFIGYGLTYEVTRPMQVAVIPVGYYDGTRWEAFQFRARAGPRATGSDGRKGGDEHGRFGRNRDRGLCWRRGRSDRKARRGRDRCGRARREDRDHPL